MKDNKYSLRDIQRNIFVGRPEIKKMFESIISTSKMPEEQKTYLRKIFYHAFTNWSAYEYVKGKKPKSPAVVEEYTKKIMSSDVMQEFIEKIKMFYMQVAPVAAMKEVEIMLDDSVKPMVKLEAAKDIQERAGLSPRIKPGQLPVNVVINIPTQTNVTVEKGGER